MDLGSNLFKIGALPCMDGCYLQKYPDLPHSLDTWKTKIIQRAEAKEATLKQMLNILLGDHQRKNPPCNAEDNLRAGLIVLEA